MRDLFDAIDPDKAKADAMAAGNPEPDAAAMQATRAERIRQAANVFTGPLIKLIDEVPPASYTPTFVRLSCRSSKSTGDSMPLFVCLRFRF